MDQSTKLLVVDDAPVMLLAYRNVLEPVVGEIDAAEALEEATALLREHDYDIVITDLSLTKPAGREGLEVIELAKRQASRPKVILVTGQGSPSVIATAQKLGADMCFEKPLDPRALVRAVTGLLRDGPTDENGRYRASWEADRPAVASVRNMSPHPEH